MRKENIFIKRKKSVIFVSGLTVFCLMVATFWMIQVIKLNRRIPQSKEVLYSDNEWVEWTDAVEVKTEGYYFMRDEEIRKIDEIPEESLYSEEMCLLWIRVRIRNEGDDERTVSLLNIAAESPGWSNIPAMDLYYAMDKSGTSLVAQLKKGDEVSCELPYLMLRSNFRESEWKKMEDKQYFVTLSLYPEKRKIVLKN